MTALDGFTRVTGDAGATADRIRALGGYVQARGQQWLIQCPHPDHADLNPSASLRAGKDGKALIHCFTCNPSPGERAAWFRRIRERLDRGEPFQATQPRGRVGGSAAGGHGRITATYPYQRGDGAAFAKVRYVDDDGRKTFSWFRSYGDGYVTGLGHTAITQLLPYRVVEVLERPGEPVYWVEGEKDADRAWAEGLVATTSASGASTGAVALPYDLTGLTGRDVIIIADRDDAGVNYAKEVRARLSGVAASVALAHPAVHDLHADLSDHLDAGYRIGDLDFGTAAAPVGGSATADGCNPDSADPQPCSWVDVVDTFRTWFGPRFDLQYLAAVLSVAASGIHLDGDPCWLLVVGGAGVGKTEALAALEPAGCQVVSTISGEAALLSGTPASERSKEATGGLLRTLGPRGMLVIKDFTSILSMRREDRAGILAALREVYDGKWVRLLGSEGGRTLTWGGRATVVGGVTSIYDEHHGVIAAMGDRFLLLRVDSEDDDVRRHASRKSMTNSGGEIAMRTELGAAVAGFLLNLPAIDLTLPDDLVDELVDVCDVITRARSQVAADFKGDPEWAHAPEMPTRIAKQLVQLWRGARLIGMSDEQARGIVRRVAHDTIPPARRLALLDVHDHPGSTSGDVARRVGMSRKTVDRKLQELALHRLVRHEASGMPGDQVWRWHPVDDRLPIIDLLRADYGDMVDGWAETSTSGGKRDKGGPTPSQSDQGEAQIEEGERFRPPPAPGELWDTTRDPWKDTA